MAPVSIARRNGPTNGVLPVPAATLQQGGQHNRSSPSKTPAPRLKIEIRRLPPGLTRTEFETALGDEWKVGGGMVDLVDFKAGKVSTKAGKYSAPARAYLHLMDESHRFALQDKFRQTNFVDAKNTVNDPALKGLPTIDFAIHQAIATSGQRTDARQGTIDMDPDFQSFLQGLTEPVAKPPALDSVAETGQKKEEKPRTSPLIEAIREAKANKGRAAAAKGSKNGRQETKDSKVEEKKAAGRTSVDASAFSNKKDRPAGKIEKATQDVVRALRKGASSAGATAAPDKAPTAPAAQTTDKKRERGSVRGFKSIIEKDLGRTAPSNRRKGAQTGAVTLSPSQPTAAPNDASKPQVPNAPPTPRAARNARSARADRSAQNSPIVDKTNTTSSTTTTPPKQAGNPPAAPTILKKPAPASQPPKGPRGKANSASNTSAQLTAEVQSEPTTGPTQPPVRATSSTTPASAPPAAPIRLPPPGATKAFIKHANASAGITEPLIEISFSPFGAITKVEIDKKKGFAYLDFAEPEGLVKAIQAGPVKVAQGTLQVLEFKERPSARNNNVPPKAPRRVAKKVVPANSGEGVQASTPGGGNGGVPAAPTQPPAKDQVVLGITAPAAPTVPAAEAAP
ncbi:Smg-4/UPF3 family-domain-containing protein [Cryomyces antarcticus]